MSIVFLSFSGMAMSESAKLVTFSTVGPDRYADDSVVLDGEYYALVWQNAKLGAVAFTASGEIANGADAAVLRVLPLAKDGCCPKTVFAIDADALPKLAGTGCLRLYLLDTRTFDASGAVCVNGTRAVQGSAPVTASVSVSFTNVTGQEDALAFVSSVLGGDVPQPKITGIRVTPTAIELTVSSTVDTVNYVVSDGAGNALSAKPLAGGAGEIKLTIPRDAAQSQGFFKIVRAGEAR